MNATGYSINVMHIHMIGSNDRDKKGKETSHFKMFLHRQLTSSFAFQTNKIENHRHFSCKNEVIMTPKIISS